MAGVSRRVAMAGGLLAAGSIMIGLEVRRRLGAAPSAARWTQAWSVLIPAILGPALTPRAASASVVATVLGRIDETVASLPLYKQAEMRTLLLVGDLPIVRRIALGMPAAWPDMTPAMAAELLAEWSGGTDARLAVAARSLKALVRMAWYADAETWPAIGFPGPPDLG